jgi:hypothetical protein
MKLTFSQKSALVRLWYVTVLVDTMYVGFLLCNGVMNHDATLFGRIWARGVDLYVIS